MSARGGRKRGRPPKTPNGRVVGKFNYQLLKKPKYLSKFCDSQESTPSVSRATSPQESDGSRGNRRKNYAKGRPGRGRKSANSNSYSARKGYESEYHYGSDFGESSDKSDMEDDVIFSASEEDSVTKSDTESDFSVCSFSQSLVGRPPRPPSPEPVWLQGRDYPSLQLPDSSEDLLIDNNLVLQALGVYEVLRRFRHLVRLSPFRFEDFCAALQCDEQSILLADVHIMLLKAILREEDVQGTHFGPLDQKDSINISLYLIDPVTWPDVLRSYVESDPLFDRQVYEILYQREYPYTNVRERIVILQFLTDQFLTTNTVRDVLLQEGPIHYDDHCRICHRLGKLLCCETCPAVYHLECVDPPLLDVPTEDWQCNLCKSHKVIGVVDCITMQEKQGTLIRHDLLGLDRHGRKFWFVARRIFVEDQSGKSIWYYSTTSKFELLLNLIDKTDLEVGLYNKMNERKEEIIRQFKLTEEITNEFKQNKKSYIDIENEALKSKSDSNKEKNVESKVITRQKKNLMDTDTQYFKLGMDNMFKSYINQYTTNPVALNKPQRNEERDKRRHLSHKFSLTAASDFKWNGSTMGSLENVVTVLKNTIINFEQNIAPPFMNPNWNHIKKLWGSAVTNCRTARDFAHVLYLFQSSLKNVLFANVWHEQLGHISLQRMTSFEREERKKIEKREKRERDEEEDRNRLSINYIKYTLGLKHQVWKQRGEEYRVHGQWGWMWLSSSRRCSLSQKCRPKQPITPHKISIHYKSSKLDEVIAVDPRTIQFIQQCEKSKFCKFYYKNLRKFQDIELQNLDNLKDIEIIDVSKSLTTPGRLLYPKIARKYRVDQLLERREKLKNIEEWINSGNQNESKQIPPNLNMKEEINYSKTFLEKKMFNLIETFKPQHFTTNSNINLDIVKFLAKKIQTVRYQFSQLNRFAKQYKCYTKECNTNSNAVSQITQNTCYSPICLQKARAKKNLLILLRKAHAAGNGSKETVDAILGAVKKPSILEQKLTESRKDYYSSNEEVDENKFDEDVPYDILVDWEQARNNAISYNLNLLQYCYTSIFDRKHEFDEKKTTYELNLAENKMDFMENMEVCSNVEVESCQNSCSDVVGGVPLHTYQAEEPSSKKIKKALKCKNKTTFGNREVTITSVSDNVSEFRENRRFPVHTRSIKKEEIVVDKEFFPNGKQKQYSVSKTAGRLYLLRNANKILDKNDSGEKDKNDMFTQYPLLSNFLTHKNTSSILILPKYELKKIARSAGKIPVSGFSHIAKSNYLWPYPCARPLFKTCWAYRTCTALNLSSIALQLRILWSCLRWDDMIAKPPTNDGKHQITTDIEIVTSELLNYKHCGRYGERTIYLRRKVTIPLEVPKTIREVTSIRSGLRKRKRAESPQPAEPQTMEEWLEEDKLELWEIKYMGEKLEKPKTTTTRSLRYSENVNYVSNMGENGAIKFKAQEDIKEKGDQFKVQRILNQKKTDGSKALSIKSVPSTGRKVIVKNPDGTTKIVHHTTSTHKSKVNTATVIASVPPISQQSVAKCHGIQSSTTSQPHKVQIIRGPDGKVSVRGLNPGQQLIQMPDGKLHVLTTNLSNSQQVSTLNKIKVAVKQNLNTNLKSNQPNKNNDKKSESPSASHKVVHRILNNVGNHNTTAAGNVAASSVSSEQKSQTSVIIPNRSTQQPVISSTSKNAATPISHNQKLITENQDNVSTSQLKLNSTSITYEQHSKQLQSNVLPIGSPSTQGGSTQKVIQQIVNTSNVQQQILVGGQRIILSPGQTIVTQRSIPSSYTTVTQQNQVSTNNELKHQTTPKFVKQQICNNTTQISPVTNISQISNISSNSNSLSNNQQIVVQNSSLAQQLAQGKLQVATINGQQVIIKPLGNNQAQIVAHIKTQSDGNAHIVTTNNFSSSNLKNSVSSISQLPSSASNSFEGPTDCNIIENTRQNQRTQPENSDASQKSAIEESLLQGQPPGTVIKCVTAQVVQTGQGPRIVLQGLVGNDFTQEQLTLVEQKVKQQLLKAQETSGKQNYLGPTKIYLAVQPPNSSMPAQPPPLTPVNQSTQQFILERHMETLKKNILKKRSLLEKKLQNEIKDEVRYNMRFNISNPNFEPLKSSNLKKISDIKKQDYQKTNDKFGKVTHIRTKKIGKKREKLYCICRTPYDETKFYVGCDLCSNWFHGECVNITEEGSKSLSEYICEECNNVKATEQLYCSCRQPYDETQFYICCDKCQDWFHGKCVGILQSEAEFIDEYICPDCEKHGNLVERNYLNLCIKETDELKQLIKQIQSHKSAWPFMEPVDPDEAPDYYNIIKDPIDLKKIEHKINEDAYNKLSEFIGDMTKMFDNCRFYNKKDSTFYKCAEMLETYFAEQIKKISENSK